MPAMKTILGAMGGAVILGSLAANAVPTRIGLVSGGDWRDTIPRHASAESGAIEHHVSAPQDLSTALAYDDYRYDYIRYPDYAPVDVPPVADTPVTQSEAVQTGVDAAVVQVSYGSATASAPEDAQPVRLKAEPGPERPAIVDAPAALAVNAQSGW